MSNGNVLNGGFQKGFRQAPAPTKGDIQKENDTLGQKVMQVLQFLQPYTMQMGRKLNELSAEVFAHSELYGYDLSSETAVAGDRVLVEFLGTLTNEDGSEGAIFEGGYSNRTLVGIGSEKFVPGFETGLIGLKAGDLSTINLVFPEGYPDHLKNRKVAFEVNVIQVYKPSALLDRLTAKYQTLLAAKLAADDAAAKAAAIEAAKTETETKPSESA